MKSLNKFRFHASVLIITWLMVNLIASYNSLARADLLINSDFELVGPNGTDTTHFGVGGVGASGAANWSVFHQVNNPDAITRTLWRTYAQLGIPTINDTQNPLTDHILVVDTSHDNNGIVQVFLPFNTGPADAIGSVWIWVETPDRQVGVGMGNGGSTNLTAFTTTTGQWEQITFDNLTSPANLIAIYAEGGATRYYVDMGMVEEAKMFLLGDVNCDGMVDLSDVNPFVSLVTSGQYLDKADINMDGSVDLLDVQPFVELLLGP